MKQIARLATLLAAVLMTVGCTKTSCWWPEDTVRDITYYLYGNPEYTDNSEYSEYLEPTTVHLTTDAEFDALLDRFCNYAQEGSTVKFYNSVPSGSTARKAATKEASTFSTTSRAEMKAWMARMEDAGMTVTVTYDPNTGTWNGTAYATAPPSNPDTDPLPTMSQDVVTYVCDASPMWRTILSVDTANHLMFFTGMLYDGIYPFIGYNLMVPDGFCRYNYYDPQDSGFYYYYNDRVFIFIQNLNRPEQANHYCLISNFDFSSDSFTLEFADYAPQDLYTVISFTFVRTDEFVPMVHRCERCDVLMHMGYGEGQSYIFPRFEGDFPFEYGKFNVTAVDTLASDGYGYFPLVFCLDYSATGNSPIFGKHHTDGISEDWYPLNYTTSAMWPAYFHFDLY